MYFRFSQKSCNNIRWKEQAIISEFIHQELFQVFSQIYIELILKFCDKLMPILQSCNTKVSYLLIKYFSRFFNCCYSKERLTDYTTLLNSDLKMNKPNYNSSLIIIFIFRNTDISWGQINIFWFASPLSIVFKQ